VYRQCFSLTVFLHITSHPRYTRSTPGCTDSASVSPCSHTSHHTRGTLVQHQGVPTVLQSHRVPTHHITPEVHSFNARVYRQCFSLTVFLHITSHPRYTHSTPGCTGSLTVFLQVTLTNELGVNVRQTGRLHLSQTAAING